MARKTANPEAPRNENEEPKMDRQAEKKRGFLWMMIRENIQDVALGILLVLGFKKPSQSGTVQFQGQERQVPDWFLSAFPGLTRDDENEYNLALDSHPDPKARIAAEEFWEMVKKDELYDEVRYVVNIVELRREFIERLRRPAPKDESGGRLGFDPLTQRDSINIFFNRLLEEKSRGGSPEEIYKRQKEIALKRKLLPKKHLFKRLLENKASAIMYFFATLFFAFGFMYFILYWIFG
ncbi:MAG TPA: hypothetical protein P5262_04205 [Candidatus Moranbacteria bacterium]|nr:hypothetical protein [Candidatus Moranbacteria bacterium]